MERLRERIEIAKKALNSLEEAIARANPTLTERDAAIQRFEYTVEAVWKAGQRYLQIVEGFEEGSPKGVIRRSREVGILEENLTSSALEMIDDRNLTAHTYNESLAALIFQRLSDYAGLMRVWLERMENRMR